MTTQEWLTYFQGNVQSPQDMSWDLGVSLTDEQQRALLPSLKAFQRGEGSEGTNLKRNAQRYAERTGDTDYVHCIDLFIREEQKHAAFLALYLRQLGETCVTTTLTDNVFRRLRKGVALEPSLTVLLTAEIMAMTYYPAVATAVECCFDGFARVSRRTSRDISCFNPSVLGCSVPNTQRFGVGSGK